MLDFCLTKEVQVEHVGETEGVEASIAWQRPIKLGRALHVGNGPAHGHGDICDDGSRASRYASSREGIGAGDRGASEAGDEGNHAERKWR